MADGQDLAAELQLADEKAQTAFPDRIDEIESVFCQVEAMRRALLMIHHNVDSPRTIDAGYKELHDAFYAFHAIPKKSKALFAFRSQPVSWLGCKGSSVIHCITDCAARHLEILQKASLHNTFCPSNEMCELHPECWFDADRCELLANELENLVPGDAIKWPSRSTSAEQTIERTIPPVIIESGENHEWHNDYFTVAELSRMREAVKLPYRSSTMTTEIKREIKNGRIQRDGNKPMRIRMDLFKEWNTQLRE